MSKFTEIYENIKGWKHAGSDLSRMRSTKDATESYEVISFTKAGKPKENTGPTAGILRSKDLEDAKRRLENIRKQNPKYIYKLRNNVTGEYLDV